MTKAAPPANAPNNEQIKEFAGYLAKWQNKLGLQGWRIEKSRRKTKAMADVKISYPDRLVTWAVGDWGATEITSHSLEKTAIHELLHVKLYPIWFHTQEEASSETIESSEHDVITTLETLLCPPPSASLTSQERKPHEPAVS